VGLAPIFCWWLLLFAALKDAWAIAVLGGTGLSLPGGSFNVADL
jgi:hypothetical protein